MYIEPLLHYKITLVAQPQHNSQRNSLRQFINMILTEFRCESVFKIIVW